MIHFLTDYWCSETPLLAGVRHEPLYISTLDGAHIATLAAPATGWTAERIRAAITRLPIPVRDAIADGANAHLGPRFIASTDA